MSSENEKGKACGLCQGNAELAEQASQFIAELANAQRLMVVALLHETGEMHVNEMVDKLDVNRASLSRNLSRLRSQGLVTTRRKHNKIFYSLNHDKAVMILKALGILAPKGA